MIVFFLILALGKDNFSSRETGNWVVVERGAEFGFQSSDTLVYKFRNQFHSVSYDAFPNKAK